MREVLTNEDLHSNSYFTIAIFTSLISLIFIGILIYILKLKTQLEKY